MAARAARPRHHGARSSRRVPGRQRRRRPRRHARRRARPLSRAGQRSASCPSAYQRFNTEPAHAPAHRRRSRGRASTPSTSGRTIFLRRARAATRVRRRRVLPARRPAVPDRRSLRGLPDARGRHRHGPHVRASSSSAWSTTSIGRSAASSRGSTGRRPRALSAHTALRTASTPVTLTRSPRRDAPVAILTGDYGARVLRRWSTTLGRDDVRGRPGAQRVLRRQHRASTGLMVGADLVARPRRRAGRPPLPAARCLPLRRPVPRRH